MSFFPTSEFKTKRHFIFIYFQWVIFYFFFVSTRLNIFCSKKVKQELFLFCLTRDMKNRDLGGRGFWPHVQE